MTETLTTTAAAQGHLGRPAPAIYRDATAGYPALFAGLTGNTLRTIERTNGTDAVTTHIQGLLDKLADWRQHLDVYEATATDTDWAAVRFLPADHPRLLAWRAAENGVTDWQNAKAATHAAYVDWSFDLTGTVDVPEPAPPTPVVLADGCRVPNCEGRWHSDDDTECYTILAEMHLGNGGSLNADLIAIGDEKPYVAVFSFNVQSDETHTRTSDPAELQALADRFYRFASAVDQAAHTLTQLTDGGQS